MIIAATDYAGFALWLWAILGRMLRLISSRRMAVLLAASCIDWALSELLQHAYGRALFQATWFVAMILLAVCGSDDDDDDQRRKRLVSWARSKIPRPTLVAIRPLDAPAPA